jgi:NAD(P)-dependent dehydrogenase (short-subunit alcohol dehydrogenase family)
VAAGGQPGADRGPAGRGGSAEGLSALDRRPEDIANIALFLASEESRMITGAAIPADGGRSAY